MRPSRYRSLSKGRVWIGDLLYFASKIPTAGFSSTIRLAAVDSARRACPFRISWSAIFVKAAALTARSEPVLRQCYMPFPWPHIYEHPSCIVSVPIERDWQGESAVLFDVVPQPEDKSLREIDTLIRNAKTAKVEALGSYRRLIRTTRYPRLLRRLLWRVALYGSGRLRMKYCGGLSVNSVTSREMHILQTFTINSANMYVEPVGPDGEMNLTIFFDHRIFDGMVCGRIIGKLEATLNDQILKELRSEAARPDFSSRVAAQ